MNLRSVGRIKNLRLEVHTPMSRDVTIIRHSHAVLIDGIRQMSLHKVTDLLRFGPRLRYKNWVPKKDRDPFNSLGLGRGPAARTGGALLSCRGIALLVSGLFFFLLGVGRRGAARGRAERAREIRGGLFSIFPVDVLEGAR